MAKLVVLKFGEGSVESGFPVTLQIAVEQDAATGQHLAYQPLAEVTGKLPPAPELHQYYRHWQATYRQLSLPTRLEAPKAQITNISVIADCHSAARALSDRFNTWLRCESFRPIREKWLEQLTLTETVRVILQTDDPLLQRLPWQVWELGDRYTQSELALSLPTYDPVAQPVPPKDKLKILAILGNSQGIDIQADRALLEQLPDAEVCFLVEPHRQQLTDQLWSQAWDILFFAGHSSSHRAAVGSLEAGVRDQGSEHLPFSSLSADARLAAETPNAAEEGYIHINTTDRLTISQLRFALRKAVERGLKLAIFNSCEGLGLARHLADLQIPQMIVMREPVPDRVAQEFLKSFLSAFSQGEPLYLAVRQARERLQGLEDQFPCATWLPMICQNPGAVPPTWQGLRGEGSQRTEAGAIAQPGRRSRLAVRQRLGPALWQLSQVAIASLWVTAMLAGIRYAGGLQSLELKAYDHLMRLRPPESEDARLLIVTIDDQEKQNYGADIPGVGRVSISDRYLNQLLTQINRAQPSVIGLDLYRDFAATPALAQQFQKNQRLITLCKARYLGADSVAPPPDAVPERVGFSDFTADPDNQLRRHLLAMTPAYIDPKVPCTATYAFNFQVAARYLLAQKIPLGGTPDTNLQFGKVVLSRLSSRIGGYQPADDRGNQILLNYRASPFQDNRVSLTDVLSGKVNPNIMKGRVILVGVIAENSPDFWETPVDPHMPGVIAQAHMVSQILSTVLDKRPLLWVWSWPQEVLWIWGWALLGGLLSWRVRSPLRLGMAIACSTVILYGSCWLMMTQAGWIPLIPPVLALLITGSAVAVLVRLKPRPAQ
ncbi:MAG TPA: CHASE2 domain-containing protein [Coleofasciculaceae cyanobacterium]